MSSPFFSIIVPTYNRGDRVSIAINSVLSQKFDNWEMIVIDDGSNDDTEDVVKKFLSDNRISYFKQDNSGVSAARNAGAQKAKGRFYLFLDSDDWLGDHYLEKSYQMLEDRNHKLLLTKIMFYSSDGKLVKEEEPGEYGNYFTHGLAGSFIISAKLYEAVEGYDEKLSFSENSDLFLRLFNGKVISKSEIGLVKNIAVCVRQEDPKARRLRYSKSRYQNATYFLDKHHEFFKASLKDYVNFKRIQVVAALQVGMIQEAKKSLRELLARKPFLPKTILMYLFVLILPSQAAKRYS